MGCKLAWQYQPASYCLFSTDCSFDYCDIVLDEFPYYYLVLSRSIFLIAPLQGLRILSVNKFLVSFLLFTPEASFGFKFLMLCNHHDFN
jgi:hypothetical protein